MPQLLVLCFAIFSLVFAPSIPGATRPPAKKAPLTLRQKVAQLVVVSFSGDLPNARSRQYRRLVRLVRDDQVGGLILISRTNNGIQRADPLKLAAFLNRMQAMARIPLLVASDFERGASMRVDDAPQFPHAMAFSAGEGLEASRYLGAETAREARALGVHWIFAPVADVNSNPDNPIINIRSFGEDPRMVAEHVSAFLAGAKSDSHSKVLTTVKHFPGHGDTSVDSHLALSSISSDKARLERVELVPFRAAIAEGVDSVMTGHISVPALDTPNIPATLSPKILTGLLRDELKFQGLIVTDALDMGGIANGHSGGEAAVRALEAGADVLLMPADPEAAIRAVLAAVRAGRLTVKRIDQSLNRVLAAKQSLGLDRNRLVDLKSVAAVINAPGVIARAQVVAERAVTLVKNQGAAVPLRNAANACFVVLSESRNSKEGQAIVQELPKRAEAAPVFSLDPSMPDSEVDATALKASGCGQIVVMAFASTAAYPNGQALPGSFPALVDRLIASGRPVTLVSLGSPYLVRRFPAVSAYLTTYSPVATSEVAAVKALFGEIDISGHLPVTIPGVANMGFGMSLPRSVH